jgi:hypothetical protein
MSIILSSDELISITGYRRPAEQLAELRRQGFHRARRSPATGAIILERAHYDAVCGAARHAPGPRLRTPTLRHA